MNEHGSHEHGHAVAKPFSDEEWQHLREADLGAGRAVIALMLSIFLIGVVLYSGVVGFVVAYPQ